MDILEGKNPHLSPDAVSLASQGFPLIEHPRIEANISNSLKQYAAVISKLNSNSFRLAASIALEPLSQTPKFDFAEQVTPVLQSIAKLGDMSQTVAQSIARIGNVSETVAQSLAGYESIAETVARSLDLFRNTIDSRQLNPNAQLYESILSSLESLSETMDRYDSPDAQIEVSKDVYQKTETLLTTLESASDGGKAIGSSSAEVTVSNADESSAETHSPRIISSDSILTIISIVLTLLIFLADECITLHLSNQQSEQVERQLAVEERILEEVKEDSGLTIEQIQLLQSIDESLKALVEATEKAENNSNSYVQPVEH